MTSPGTEADPLRVAIIGAGPAGFYAADALLKQPLTVQVDMFDRLPTPFGLVRSGVAPDHQKIKTVTKAFSRTAQHPTFRFFGYVEFGKDLTIADLRAHYHQIIYTSGAQTDRKLGIPGEDFRGSHTATEFVAWYNGHPDYREREFDLSQERVVVIGMGNVAMDVARILCRDPDVLAKTDIADYALDALRRSRVKEVTVLGRRGPAQAAFTNPEIKELTTLKQADVIVPPDEAALDPLSAEIAAKGSVQKKVDLLQELANTPPMGLPKRLTIRFLVSPVEILGDEAGQISAIRLVKNELYAIDGGNLRPRPTDIFETLPVGLVFRSIGYRGLPLPGVPFNADWGVIANAQGRIIDADGQPVTGEYTAGWIKRGPSGVIGTNKPDAVETVNLMLQDLAAGRVLSPANPGADAIEGLVKQRQPRYFSFADWQKLDALEIERGEAAGRPRVKFTAIDEMLAAVGR